MNKLNTTLLVALLSTTLHYHNELPYRKELFLKIKELFEIKVPKRARNLVSGLKKPDSLSMKLRELLEILNERLDNKRITN